MPRRPRLMIISDGMRATRCPADGRVYDSRSAYMAAVRRAGCEVVDDKAEFMRSSVPETDWQSELLETAQEMGRGTELAEHKVEDMSDQGGAVEQAWRGAIPGAPAGWSWEGMQDG